MKRSIRKLGGFFVLGAAAAIMPLGAVAANQQTLIETTTTTTNIANTAGGTLKKLAMHHIEIWSGTSKRPLRFRYDKETAFVDEKGMPVDASVLKKGMPLQVFYGPSSDGDHLFAHKIMVQGVAP